MLRETRVRLVIGLSVTLTGIAFAFGTSWLVIALAAPVPDMANPHKMVSYMSNLQSVKTIAQCLYFTGMGIATIGFLITFVTWAKWFIDAGEPRKLLPFE